MMDRWSKPNGYRQVLAVSLPLVASMLRYRQGKWKTMRVIESQPSSPEDRKG